MPKALDFTIGGSSASYEKTLKRVETMSAASAKSVRRNFEREFASINAKMSSLPADSLVARRLGARRTEIEGILNATPSSLRSYADVANVPGGKFEFGGRSNRAAGFRGGLRSLGAASPMFISAGRDTLTSLASGAPITQVMAQQLPQVIQGFTQMRLGLALLRLSLVGAAVGGLAFFATKAAQAYIGTQKLKDSFTALAQAAERFRHANQLRWDDKIAAASKELLRYQKIASMQDFQSNAADAETDLEKARATKEALAGKTNLSLKEELELEKKLLEIDLARAKAKLEQAINSQESQQEVAKAELELLEAQEAQEAMIEKQKDAFQKKMKDAGIPMSESAYMPSNADLLEQAAMRRRIAAAEGNLDTAKQKHGQPAIDRAEAEILSIENRLARAGFVKPDALKPDALKTPSVTDRQRIGLMSVGDAPMLDVARAQLKALQTLVAQGSRSGGSINQHFGAQ